MENENKLPLEFKAKWVEALRGGKFEQGKSNLHKEGKFCCLGVACVVAGVSLDDISNWPLISNRKEFEKVPIILHDSDGFNVGLKLANMNDSGKSFSEIADYIEANL